MRIYKVDVRCQMSDVRYFLISVICLLTSSCYSTVEYYRRGEGYASEKINAGVNSTLGCDAENKGKSYCDDSKTNKEKQYQAALARANAPAPPPPPPPPPSQTPLSVSKGPQAPLGPELERNLDAPVITPLEPAAPIVIEEPLLKPEPKKAVVKKKKSLKKSAKKPVKKSAKKPLKKKEPVKAKDTSAEPPPADQAPPIDSPLLPNATDNMLQPERITP